MNLKSRFLQIEAEMSVLRDQVDNWLRVRNAAAQAGTVVSHDTTSIHLAAQTIAQHLDAIMQVVPAMGELTDPEEEEDIPTPPRTTIMPPQGAPSKDFSGMKPDVEHPDKVAEAPAPGPAPSPTATSASGTIDSKNAKTVGATNKK